MNVYGVLLDDEAGVVVITLGERELKYDYVLVDDVGKPSVVEVPLALGSVALAKIVHVSPSMLKNWEGTQPSRERVDGRLTGQIRVLGR